MSFFESDLERRVLGNLPPWRSEEGQRIAAAENDTIAGFSVGELAQRLAISAAEVGHPVFSEPDVRKILTDLAAKGYAVEVVEGLAADGSGHPTTRFRMTQTGLQALQAPEDNAPPPHDLLRIESMVGVSEKLVAAGMGAGSSEFNRAGGLDRKGFRDWRLHHAVTSETDGPTEATLDALEARAPEIPAVTEGTPAAPSPSETTTPGGEATNAPA
jgi:hypothetical protein